jgi:hypothetical protein
MTPLETVAYHIWKNRLIDRGVKAEQEDFALHLEIWRDAPEDEKRHVGVDADIRAARDGLLALAGANFPSDIVRTGAAQVLLDDAIGMQTPHTKAKAAFRAMLLAIAEGTGNG